MVFTPLLYGKEVYMSIKRKIFAKMLTNIKKNNIIILKELII